MIGKKPERLSKRSSPSVLSALAGFCFYGVWAFYVNMQHGLTVGIKAGLTQGSYSFAITWVMSQFMETLFQLTHSQHISLRFIITVVVTCLTLFATSWGINALLGTPEILMTILPGMLIGALYSLGYTLNLCRIEPSSQQV